MLNLILEKILLPLGDLILGSQYIQNLKHFRSLTKESEQSILSYQKSQLQKILTTATLHSQHYKPFKACKNEDPYGWLKQFPVLTKEVIRNNPDSLLTRKKEGLIKNSTSGSTGVQTEIWVTKREQSVYRAAQTLWWEWAGFYPGYPILQTGLATSRSFEKRLKDLFFRTHYLFAFGLDKEKVRKALQWAKGKKPVLGGYASSLYVLAELSEDQERVQFKSAISWGDKLFDHYRKKIEKTFDCKVYETYGAGEGLMMASQKDLDYLYIMSPCVYLEILDDQGNEVPDGELGHVVVTSLIHEAMPLIRYKLGDLAIKLPKQNYPVTRELSLPLLQKVVGRETDLVLTPSGKKLIVHSFTGVFEYFPQVKQFCIIQEQMQGVQIQYIRGTNFSPTVLGEIQTKLKELLNEPFDFHFTEVDFIPPTKSGKPQIIISKLNK